MASYLDIEKLANLVRNKRQNRGLREIAKEIGNISISTISRVENGKIPDIDTFLVLCDWLGVPPAEFIKNTASKEAVNTPETIAAQLLADQHLDPAIANALIILIKAVLG